jgi:protein tyrosine/serine phosphatase
MFKYAKRLTRPYMRTLQSGYRGVRRSIREGLPPWLGPKADHALEHFDLIMVDHGMFRLAYLNRHAVVSGRVYRSAQPSPRDIARLARRGVRTIVNLRGDRDCGSYRLEKLACERHGITLIDFTARSREAPPREFFHEANALFASIEYPMLMHCKSGADRAGLMSVLYLILAEGRPAEQALRHLSLRYGHIKHADTGVLDSIFTSYIEHNRRNPIAFLDWIDAFYDPKQLKAKFASRSLGNLLVNGVLRRE